MKIKKKLVGIMLSAILGCTFITGCESKSGNEESASGDTAKVEIKNEGIINSSCYYDR